MVQRPFAWRRAALGAIALLAVLMSTVGLAEPADAQASPGAPDAPASVSVTRGTFGAGELIVAWTGGARADKAVYNVRMSEDGGQTWTVAASDVAGTTVTIDSGVNDALPYLVGVQAENEHGVSAWTAAPMALPECPVGYFCVTSAPGAPGPVTVTRADGTLTAAWDAVQGALSYHVTYSGDGGASWSLAALDHTSAEIVIQGVDNATTYVVGVRAKNALGYGGWRNSAPAGPYNAPAPPGTPASVTVTRADGSLTASWAAVAGATSYHVTYTGDGGGSWSLAALHHTETGIDIGGVDNAKTYLVGVRARNAAGDGGWRNSAPAGPYTPPTLTPTPTPTPAPTPPGTAQSVTLTRADGSVTATWPAVAGATAYHVTYTDNGAQSWQLAALDHPASGGGTESITFAATNGSTYIVGVRAKNSAGGSAWRNSPAAGPFTPPPTLTVTDPTSTSAVLTMDNYSGDWYYSTSETSGGGGGGGAGIASAQSVTCTGPVNGSEATITGLDPDSGYTITAYGNGQCGGASIASATAQTQGPISLTPGNETTDGATLTISGSGYTGGAWWYAQTAPNDGLCTPASGASAAITGLLPGRAYTYAAYGNEKCHPGDNTLATATFTTQYGLRVDGLTENSATLVIEGSGLLTNWWYKRTAPSGDDTCHASGYAQKSVALSLTPKTTYGYSAYVDSACAAAVGSVSFKTPGLDGSADTNANTLTLTIVNWTKADGTTTAAWWYRQTAPTAGTCTPVAEGTSSVTLSGFTFDHTNRNQYVYEAYSKVGCDAADAIARKHLFPAYSSRGGVEHVTATTATFLAYNTGANSQWGYKSTETGAPCVGPFDGFGSQGFASAPVTGLTPGTTYTFQAYASDQSTACSARFDTDVTFTTAPASVSNLGERQAGSTLPVGWSANDWTASAFTTGTGASSFTLERVTLLFGGSGIGMPAPEYDLNVRLFSAGSDGNPDAAIANAALSGPARPAENSTAVYECSGDGCALDTDTDYYVVLSVPVPQCRTFEGVQDCSGTTGRAYYWQRAGTNNETASPADSGFSIANEIRHTDDGGSTWTRLLRAVMFSVEYAMPAPSLDASAITTSTAALTLANEGGESAWYARQLSPSEGTCSSAIANGSTLALTGLQQNTGYTYAAYRDSACTQVAASGTFTTLRTLTASSVTDTTATLALSGSGTGSWYVKYTTPSGGTCSSGVGYGGALDLTNLGRNTAYTYEAYSDSGCTTVIGRTSFTTEANWIAVSGIHTDTATLTLTGHTGGWSLKRISPAPAGTCEAGEADFSHALSSLTEGTTYTYAAYGDATCTTALRSVTFATAVTVSNIGESAGGTPSRVGYFVGSVTSQYKEAAQGFTTGSNASGYTLSSITVKVSGKTGNPGAIEVKLHAASGVNIGSELATLSGSDPSGSGDYTYACTPSSSDNCALSRNTTYYIKLRAPNAPTGANNYYSISTTPSTGETRVPSTNGWNLADNGRERHGTTWLTNTHALRIEVAASPPPGPSLLAFDVASTSATLTLTGHVGDWWLQQTSPSAGTCSAGESDYLHALSSLTAGTSYTYKAYSDSACATTALQSVTFTAPLDNPGNVGAQYQDTSNTSTANNQLKVWWTRATGATGSVGYTVDCSSNNGTSWTASCATVAAATDDDVSATISTSGYNKVRVRATKSGANSGWVESAVPSGTPPGAPTSLAIGIPTNSGYPYTWNKPSSPSGAVGYETQCVRVSQSTWEACGSNGTDGIIDPTTDATVTTYIPTGTYSKIRVRAVVDGLVSTWVNHPP